MTKNGATLGGTVNPKGGTVSNCHFEYVTEAAFQSGGFTGATSKACTTTPSGNVASRGLGESHAGLAAGTAYRFRVVATSNSGTAPGDRRSLHDGGGNLQPKTRRSARRAETPAVPASPPPAGPLPIPAPRGGQPKPLKCHKGFKKKRVRGKLKCVRVKKHRAKH